MRPFRSSFVTVLLLAVSVGSAGANPVWPWGIPADVDGDGRISIDDLHHITRSPIDLNGDGYADQQDVDALARALRAGESWSLLPIERLQDQIPQFTVYPNSTSYSLASFVLDGVLVEYFGSRADNGAPLALDRLRYSLGDEIREITFDDRMKPTRLADLSSGQYISLTWVTVEPGQPNVAVVIWGGPDGIEGSNSVEIPWQIESVAGGSRASLSGTAQNVVRFDIQTDEGRIVPHSYADTSALLVDTATGLEIDAGLVVPRPIQGTDLWEVAVPNPCAPQVQRQVSAEETHRLGLLLCNASPQIDRLVGAVLPGVVGRVYGVLSCVLSGSIQQTCQVTSAMQRSLVTFGGDNLADRFVNRQDPAWPDSFRLRVNARLRDGASRDTGVTIGRDFDLDSCPQPSAEPTVETLAWANSNGFRPPSLSVREEGPNLFRISLGYPVSGLTPKLDLVQGVGEVAAYRVYFTTDAGFQGSRPHRSANRRSGICMPDQRDYNSTYVGLIPSSSRSVFLEVEGCSQSRFFAFAVIAD